MVKMIIKIIINRMFNMYLIPILLHQKTASGFGRELWQLGEIRPAFTVDGLESVAVEIDAPAGETVYLNGIPVGDRWLTGGSVPCPELTELESRFAEQPSYVRYRVEPLYGAIAVTDSRGRALAVTGAGEEGVVRCTKQGQTLRIRVSSGVASVENNEAIVLVSDAARIGE